MVYTSKRSIEDFKSNLANGGVRPTMFEVQITFPQIISGGADNNTTLLEVTTTNSLTNQSS